MKEKIAIVAGGYSSESEVSLRSAQGIYSFLDKERFDVSVVWLDKQEWTAIVNPFGKNEVRVPINRNDFSYTLDGEIHKYDFAYITIHGTPGENGLLQGYFDMLGVPYSCCGVLAAALTFNKFVCNHYLSAFGVRISPSRMLRKGETITNQEVVEQIGLPCFIKSNVGGSSYGCTKVKTEEAIQEAVQAAFHEGDEVIIEAFMQGTEITCGAYKTQYKAVAFPITEVVTTNEFFDYDAKYKGQVDEITPARIPDALRDAVQALTLRIYDIIGCHGIIRIDYILTPSNSSEAIEGYLINLLEVNTTPGMTATSFIPQQVRAAGLNITEVLTEIIENSITTHHS